jgi:hypothetical protein
MKDKIGKRVQYTICYFFLIKNMNDQWIIIIIIIINNSERFIYILHVYEE